MNQLTKAEILKNSIGNVSGFHDLTQWHKEFLYKAMEEYSQQQVELERQKVKGLLEAAQEIHDYLNETHYENGKPVQRNLIGANSILHNNLQTALTNYNNKH